MMRILFFYFFISKAIVLKVPRKASKVYMMYTRQYDENMVLLYQY